MSSSTGAGTGVASPCAIQCEGGGGNCNNQNNSAFSGMQASFSHSMQASVSGSVGWGAASASASASSQTSASAGAQTGSNNVQNSSSCPPNVTTDSTVSNISNTLMSVDQSTLITNTTALSALSSSVNQMVTNSMTSTSTSSNQNVMITQVLKIDIKNVQGNVDISNISQYASVNASNTISMDLTAIDNVRNDLANQVLQQFAASSNTDSINAAQASIEKELASSNEAATTLNQNNQVKQTQNTEVPMAQPTTIIPPVPGSNVNTKQTTLNSATSSTIISAPYTQSNNISRSIQSSVLNAVTQNFTHETVTQLVTAININQAMGFSISDVVGNVSIKNISQSANVVITSTLNQHMNIGTAIVNSVASSLGTSTDDKTAIKKSQSTTLKDTSTLRASSTSTNTTTSTFSYDQALTQSLVPGCGCSGSSFLSSLILAMVFFIGPMLMKGLPDVTESEEASSEAETSDSPASTPTSSSPSSSPESTPKAVATQGGYYFY